MIDQIRLYDRQMTRSAFQSLFWVIFSARKRQEKLTKKALADKLGINKSFVTRAFDEPPNWQIDTISDISDALGVDLVIEARDRATGVIYTPSGERLPLITSSSLEHVQKIQTGSTAVTSTDGSTVVAA